MRTVRSIVCPCCWVLVLLSEALFFTSATAEDPCTFAADPELCHYEKAALLLNQISSQQPSAPRVPTAPVSDAASAAVDAQDHSAAPSSEWAPADGVVEFQSRALKQALNFLEGDAPVSPILEDVTMKLEGKLDDLEPGAVTTFREQHLAATINAHEWHSPTYLRAAKAAGALSTATWPTKGVVADSLAELERLSSPTTSLLQRSSPTVGMAGRQPPKLSEEDYLCSRMSCGTFGCASGVKPANAKCSLTSENKCADGYGKCRKGRGEALEGTFQIEFLAAPGKFLQMPEYNEDDHTDISMKLTKPEEKNGTKKVGPMATWHLVKNADDQTVMMYSEKWGTDFWSSVEQTKGEYTFSYRGFSSPIACSFESHTNKEGDEVYLKDVLTGLWVQLKDDKFKGVPDLDKKASAIKFHPKLPDSVKPIADSACAFCLAPLFLLGSFLNL